MRSLRTWFALVLACGVVAPALAALNPRDFPDPRPAGWVVDRAGLLQPEDVATINACGDAIRARHGQAGLFVVTVPSTAGANHRRFATQLLNRWGPDADLRSGVLILVARDDRRAELVLGDDLLARFGTSASDRIMRDEIVARLKQNDPRGALFGAVRACAGEYFGVQADASGRITPPTAQPGPATDQPLERPAGAEPVRSGGKFSDEHPALAVFIGTAMILVPLGAFAAALTLIVRALAGPRKCRRCALPMRKLDAAAELPHLAPAEQLEERLRSVNYDVWLCGGCGGVEKVRHGKWFTRYSRCPKCAAVTRSRLSRTVNAATRYSTGLAEVTEHCENCGFHLVTMQTLAMLTNTDSSSSSSSSGSSSSSSSSGGGSSGSW